MSKSKPRFLRLKLRAITPGVSKDVLLDTLLQSIQKGNYEYPSTWQVGIGWSNSQFAPLKWGEFTREMLASAKSSPGFDLAVSDYLETLR